jgi:preprotein translocase subunit SecA
MLGRRSEQSQQIDAVREAAERTLGLRPYDVQIRGGLVISGGGIAEMQTGEGKTLTAVLPVFQQVAQGRHVLVATANDYLAARDAEKLRPVYEALGLRAGCVQSGQSREERRLAYQCDVTYGTAKEFGFDYLRDRLEARRRSDSRAALLATGPARVQREPGFLLLDEIDSLLIDEARTPLIISGPVDSADAAHAACFRWSHERTAEFALNRDYILGHDTGWPALLPAGRARFRRLEMPDELASLNLTELHHFLERALYVNHRFERDRHYVVQEGEIRIVDEYTGRIQPGRTWNDGIHQAIEAREGVKLSVETGHLARVTMQDFVRRFPLVGGMTGTAREAAREFRRVYRLRVHTIPTHRPVARFILPDAVFAKRAEKSAAIVAEAAGALTAGRSVLVGTPTISASVSLAEQFRAAGHVPVILNALQAEEEAEIIAHAGERGHLTIATNMAGRGTDILLGDDVRAAGGLHVIGTELHTAARIDRQLAGRCGRQGDPGSFRQFLSLDDSILDVTWGEEEAARIRTREQRSFNPSRAAERLRAAQRRTEREHERQRESLLGYNRELQRATAALGLDPVLDAVE